MYDVTTGRPLWSRAKSQRPSFAGATGILLHHSSATGRLELLDARTGACRAVTAFSYLANTWSSRTPDGRYYVVTDVRPSNLQASFWERWLANWFPQIFGDDCGIAVMETATGRPRFHLAGQGQHGLPLYLSDDGSILVTVDPDAVPQQSLIRIWDVHPHRAWTWALTIAAGTGLGLWCCRRGARSLRRDRSAKLAAPSDSTGLIGADRTSRSS